MATLRNSNNGQPDSIIASKLPNELLPDLKALLLGHFAHFGRILRISCATKGCRERTAHIQFSTSTEAFNACQNGKVVNGHTMIITITEKRPSTQILTPTPQPTRALLRVPAGNSTSTENKSNVQATLTAYFQRPTPPNRQSFEEKKEVKLPVPSVSSILDEAVNAASASVSTARDETEVDRKPNSCDKLEVFQGTSRSYQAPLQVVGSTSNSSALVPVASTTGPIRLRPTRTLSQILNLDTSKMKVVKTVTASDALACQYFMDARSHPFPLSLMFGRIPGSVIMPVKSIMDSIKPGMVITDDTVKMAWNTLLQGVLKNVLSQRAKSILQESIVDKLTLEAYSKLEEDVINQEVAGTAEKEVGYEEDILICCEDVMDAMLGLVTEDLIENTCGEEIRCAKAISKAVECCFRKLTGVILSEMVFELMPDAIVDNLCEEVVDDILDSPIFERHVRVVAAEAFKTASEERVRSINSGSSSTIFTRKGLEIDVDIPLVDRRELTRSWLQTSSFNLHKDFRATETEVIIESDISSLESSLADSSSTKSSVNSLPGSRPIVNSTSVSYTANDYDPVEMESSSPIENSPVNTQSGFFVSLKRKVTSWRNSFENVIKRRRRNDDCDDDDDK